MRWLALLACFVCGLGACATGSGTNSESLVKQLSAAGVCSAPRNGGSEALAPGSWRCVTSHRNGFAIPFYVWGSATPEQSRRREAAFLTRACRPPQPADGSTTAKQYPLVRGDTWFAEGGDDEVYRKVAAILGGRVVVRNCR